jgi:hypothetical protein
MPRVEHRARPAHRIARSFVLLLAGICATAARADDRTNDAIDRGVDFLLSEIEKAQVPTWKDDPVNRGPGEVALETYALVVAGVSVNHPTIRKNFTYLEQKILGTNYTYAIACYIFALDAAIAQEEADLLLSNMDVGQQQPQRKFRDNPAVGREYRTQLTAAITRMASIRQATGGWNYGPGGGRFDNSNTQFAVLSLGVALKRNIPLDTAVWEKTLEHFLKYQMQQKGEEVHERLTPMSDSDVANRRLRGKTPKERFEVEVKKPEKGDNSSDKKDTDKKDADKKDAGATAVAKKTSRVGSPDLPIVGTEDTPVYRRGWGYIEAKDVSWNMTCAGLSSLLLAREALKGRIPPAQLESVNAAVRDGYGWLMVNWSPTSGYYGMYSLEKVADIGEVQKFGGHDWYAELSSHLVGAQTSNGGWPAGEHGDGRVSTAFALLILNRATQLVMMPLMSQNPLSKIMVSGKRSNINDPTDRTWVYVPELDTTIHYPTLLRTIRMRAHPKLMKFLGSIIEHYPDEWKGELIPEMARARDEILQKDARKAIEGYLADITGYKYTNWEDYLKWHARWEKVTLIGVQQKADRIPDLLKYYEHTQKSIPLKKTIMWALLQCKAREAIPLFLADLDNADARIRIAAYNSFKAYFVAFPPAFDPNASDGVRAQQVSAIKAWYEEQQKKK